MLLSCPKASVMPLSTKEPKPLRQAYNASLSCPPPLSQHRLLLDPCHLHEHPVLPPQQLSCFYTHLHVISSVLFLSSSAFSFQLQPPHLCEAFLGTQVPRAGCAPLHTPILTWCIVHLFRTGSGTQVQRTFNT